MSWSHIKTVLILLLLAVNVYLVYAISSQYSVTARLSPEEISEASRLLGNEGIVVPDSVLSGKRPDLKVWRSAFQESGGGREAILSRLFGSAAYASHMTASGIEVSVEGVGAVSFSDSDPLYIAYISEECEYDGGLDGALSDTARDGQVSWMRRANLANQLEIFLAGGEGSTLSSDEKRAGVEVDQAVYDKENRRYIAHFIQKIDGCVIDGCEGYFSVKNDKVDYFKGSAVLLSGPSAYKAELLDEINVLFLELDDMLGVADAPQGVTAAAPTGQPSRTVTGTSPVYCVIWNSDRSEFYLIPSWRISYRYADGETGESIRNAVNGSVYLR